MNATIKAPVQPVNIPQISQEALRIGRLPKPIKYRVLVGKHIQNGADGREYVYPAGSIVESWYDLERLNQYDPVSGAVISQKFARVFEEDATAMLPATAQVWDSAKESLEDFVARVKANQPQPSSTETAQPNGAGSGVPLREVSGQAPSSVQVRPVPDSPLRRTEEGQVAPAPSPSSPRGPSPADQVKQLESMTLNELIKVAEEEEVDLKGAKTKAEVVKVLRQAYGI